MTEPASRDPPLLAGWRFALELAAWAALWLAWGIWAVVPAVLALALFNTPGDKRVVIVAVPGPIRLVVEALVELAGAYAVYTKWGAVAAGAFLLVYVLYLIAAHERLWWLLTGRE